MYDRYATEIYLKHHSEDLQRQAEYERQITRAGKILAGKKNGHPEKKWIRIQVEPTRPGPYVLTIRI